MLYQRKTKCLALLFLLGAVSGQILFGRCNELRHGCGRVLADVVEVLPRLM